MRFLSYLFVSACWSVSPLIKRRVVDYMSLADVPEESGSSSPVPTFVALFSLASTVTLALLAAPTPYRAYTAVVPAEGWTLLMVGAASGAAASIVLVGLLRDGNPGLAMVYLNAATGVMTYVAGALLYGKVTFDGMAGVCMIAAGVALTQG